MSIRQVTLTGGNLFQVAAQYLGDATQWNAIAALNSGVLANPQDPFFSGPVTLLIPPPDPSGGNGGILGG
jgi:hypothetical protein